MEIRAVELSDVKELLGIYSEYVKNTAISFEYEVPSEEEFSERIRNITKKHPYIVAVDNGCITGYAYAGAFKSRKAYDHCVETTVYVAKDRKKSGIGKALYTELTKLLKDMGYKNMYACIAVCDEEDEYLTNNSMQFHEHMGFALCGRFHKCGYKFGNWYDMVWMEKFI